MNEPLIQRLNAALEGRYTVEGELGAGGMATVYLANDLKHERKVALKVLKPELAAVIGGERFLTEIKTTASLQHPHILPLFDSGEADGFLFYVMPYVDGETLRDRLDRERQLPVEEAVSIATAVASALQYAHEHDVIHRDIKPENILIHAGQPVVADFGIALAVSQAGGGRMTETGLSLGTPHYMSPEQATADRDLSARSDVYSLACVLYEMLAGDPPHIGPTAQTILMRILTETPRPVTEVRRAVSPHIAATLARALEKLPADRFESAEAFTRALGDSGFTHAVTAATAGADAGTAGAATLAPAGEKRLLAVAAFAVLATAAAAWGWARPSATPAPLTMVRMALPDSQALVPRYGPRISISPDGRSIVYVGPSPGGLTGSGAMLWLRELDQLNARPLRGTEGAYIPVFAPDGKSVAFTTGFPGALKVATLLGDAPVTVLSDSVWAYGSAWSSDGWIYYTQDDAVLRVRAQGGDPETVTGTDSTRDETWRGWPATVPGGRTVLFGIWMGGVATAEFGAVNLESGESRVLGQGLYPQFSATGHVVFTRADGTVMAAPFDEDRLEFTAPPAVIFDGLGVNTQGFVELAMSETGTLLFNSGSGTREQLVWVQRDGVTTPVDSSFTGDFEAVTLSPDGTRIAASVTLRTGNLDIYVKESSGSPWTRVTFEGAQNSRPRWKPNSREVTFTSTRAGAGASSIDAWTVASAGTGSPELTLDSERTVQEVDWSPDGAWLVFRLGSGSAGVSSRDIYALRAEQPGDTLPVAATRFSEFAATFSRDGHWIAYVSNESGRNEVFVRPFPNVNAGKWQVSTSGGAEPAFGPQNELFYRANGALISATYTTSPTFAVVGREALFPDLGYDTDVNSRAYDVSPDGQRFLMIGNAGGGGHLVLAQNWFQELLARVEGARQ